MVGPVPCLQMIVVGAVDGRPTSPVRVQLGDVHSRSNSAGLPWPRGAGQVCARSRPRRPEFGREPLSGKDSLAGSARWALPGAGEVRQGT